MGRYHFNVHGETIELDGIGKVFPDLEGAKTFATAELRAMAADHVMRGRLSVHDHIDITDEAATVLHTLRVGDVVEISFSQRDRIEQ